MYVQISANVWKDQHLWHTDNQTSNCSNICSVLLNESIPLIGLLSQGLIFMLMGEKREKRAQKIYALSRLGSSVITKKMIGYCCQHELSSSHSMNKEKLWVKCDDYSGCIVSRFQSNKVQPNSISFASFYPLQMS